MISIVVTTCKRKENILKRAVDSVLQQTYPDWELFIIDDSPKDWPSRDTISRMMEYYQISDERVKYVQNTENIGACASRNIGLKMAQGEYIAFLDDDDEWKPEKLEKQVALLENGSDDLALVYCGSIYYDDKDKQIIDHKTIYRKDNGVFDYLIVHNFIGGASFPLLRTSAMRTIGGFDPNLQSGQDLDVWLRLAEKYKIDYIEEDLVVYHLYGGEQISTSPKKKLVGLAQKMDKYQAYLANHKRTYYCCIMDMAALYVMNKEYEDGIKTWVKGVLMFPFSISNNIKNLLRMGKWSKLSRRI